MLSQCLGRGAIIGPGIAGPGIIGPGIGTYGAYEGLAGPGCGGVASSGGGFIVSSVSPFAPTGLTVISENAIEGPLVVGGNLPFLATVGLEGTLPTAGAGSVSYGCGDGAVGIVSEGPIATGIVGPGSYAPGLPVGPAYGPALGAAGVYGPGLIAAPGYAGYGGLGCGCGAIY